MPKTAKIYSSKMLPHVMFREPNYVQVDLFMIFCVLRIAYSVLHFAYCYAAVECDVLGMEYCVLRIACYVL